MKQNFFKLRPVGAELLHADRRTDRQTDRNYEASGHFSKFFERRKNWQFSSADTLILYVLRTNFEVIISSMSNCIKLFFLHQALRLQFVEASWNVMAHAQKADFVFRRNGRVHLNRRGRQFSRLLAAELCTSALIVRSNARYTMFRGSVKSTGYPLHSPVSPSLPLPCVTVCHHISTGVYQFLNFAMSST
jgi:hypothetical protein